MQHGSEILLLLAGGDKSTQQNDIRTALKLAKEIRGEALIVQLKKYGTSRIILKPMKIDRLIFEAALEEAGDDPVYVAYFG